MNQYWIPLLPVFGLAGFYLALLRPNKSNEKLRKKIYSDPGSVQSIYLDNPELAGYTRLVAKMRNGSEKVVADYHEINSALKDMAAVGLTPSNQKELSDAENI